MLKPGDQVLLKNSRSHLTLLRMVSAGTGGEGAVYETSRSTEVAKIYHHAPGRDHVDKLRHMINYPPDDPESKSGRASIAWPQDLVEHSGTIVGFTMPKAPPGVQLVVALSDRKTWAPDFLWNAMVLTAMNVATAFEHVHAKGYVVGDIKPANILVTKEGLVTLVDNDSFQVTEKSGKIHYCPVYTDGFLPPELFGPDLKTFKRTAAHDAFGLGVLTFKLLMCDVHPFVGAWQGSGDPPGTDDGCVQLRSYVYRRGSLMAPKPTVPPLQSLPPTVQTLFTRCFDDGLSDPDARPTASQWRMGLYEMLRSGVKCKIHPNRHWHYRGTTCPWCDLLQRKGVDYFGVGNASKPAVTPAAKSAPVVTPSPTPYRNPALRRALAASPPRVRWNRVGAALFLLFLMCLLPAIIYSCINSRSKMPPMAVARMPPGVPAIAGPITVTNPTLPDTSTISVAPPAPAPPTLEDKVAKLLATARSNSDRENWMEALANLAELLKLAPDHTEARALQAKIASHFKIDNPIGMTFALMPPGTFIMGSPANESGRRPSETQHQVTLTRMWYMAIHPVTRGQFRKFVEDDHYKTDAEKAGEIDTWNHNRTFEQNDNHPVVLVTWKDANAFIDWLNRTDRRTDGRTYRLPTEAEWEFACRGGTTTRYNTGDGAVALPRAGWYSFNSVRTTHPVGELAPNGFGLYDMHGNAWQWCFDAYGNYPAGAATDPTGPAQRGDAPRVLRGGAWSEDPANCRSAYRGGFAPLSRFSHIGFRVCLNDAESAPAPVLPAAVSPAAAVPSAVARTAVAPATAWPAAPLAPKPEARPGQSLATNTLGMTFALIPAGTFIMGSPEDEEGRYRDETPHRVTLSRPFYMAIHHVTRGQFRKFLDATGYSWTNNNSFGQDDQHPVVGVSWNDALAFINWLNRTERSGDGRQYRLPTEAEWEFACRGGTTTRFYTGDRDDALDEAGWYSRNSGQATHPVGQKKPNAFGLFDMHGNALQWCSDVYSDYPSGAVTDPKGGALGANAFRAMRGGAWSDGPRFCRSALRRWFSPGDRYNILGFRLCFDAPASLRSSVVPAFPAVPQFAGGIENLLQSAKANDSKGDGMAALADLAEIQKLAPDHAEARALQLKIAGYFSVTNPMGMKFALVPAGTFIMGSPESETGHVNNEKQHQVTLSRPFFMAVHHVTRGQFRKFVENDHYVTDAEKAGKTDTWSHNRFFAQDDNHPVVQVSWNDAMAFVDWLHRTQRVAGTSGYRLPTEAEWEWACRAGTKTRFYTGDSEGALDDAAWTSSNSAKSTHPVLQKRPNALGLYDMLGNAWQWCFDNYGPYPNGPVTDPVGTVQDPSATRVVRGGAWLYGPRDCRSACRYGGAPTNCGGDLGFRVCLDLADSAPATASPALVSPAPVAPGTERRLEDALISPTLGSKFVLIPAGTFTMGSPKGESDSNTPFDETQHQVTLTRPWYMAIHPVTRGQFRKFVSDDHYITDAERKNKADTWKHLAALPQDDDHPVVAVSWNDTTAFIAWLNRTDRRADGRKYRLPTEAEWEYAARAGAPDPPRASLGDYAWFADNSDDESHPVGLKKPNAWGLYDVLGNVREWVEDRAAYYDYVPLPEVSVDPKGPQRGTGGGGGFGGGGRGRGDGQRPPKGFDAKGRLLINGGGAEGLPVFRGGGWDNFAPYLRLSSRYYYYGTDLKVSDIGFRLVREAQ
jgi:formylglycine-generating enzyme required for sulfatase activity